ncbi:terminase large subunit [Vibrio vulnificus]|nr:terminase large subunit [Vibrio vulnificus]
MYKGKFWDLSNIDVEQYNIRAMNPELKDTHGHSIQGDYYQGVEAAYQYAYDVIKGNRIAGRAEIGACERFIFDLNRDDLFFDIEESEFVILVANQLTHQKGELVNKPFFLLPFMIFILSQMFGFFYSKNARETLRGQRRFNTTLWAVARGNSKTAVGAIASIVNMLINENGAPIGTCSAPIQKQSRLSFEDISLMLKSSSPSLRKRFVLLKNEIRIPHNNGKIFPTSKSAGSLDGIRVAGLALVDELHEHPDDSIVQVLQSGQGSSKNPQMLIISTAGKDTQSYCRREFDKAEQVALNRITLDRYLSIIYKIDEEDYENWHDEVLWEKANPALYHAVEIEFLRSKFDEARLSESARADFLTKRLNVFVDFDEDKFISSVDLFACRNRELNRDDYKGKTCYLGLDLAGKSDLSSLVYIFPSDDGGIDVFQKSFIPEAAHLRAPPNIQALYLEAQKKGELSINDGNITNYDLIKNEILAAYKDYDVQALSLDIAAGGEFFSSQLEEDYGIEGVSIKQGFGLSEYAIQLQRMIMSSKFQYNSDLLEWCYINALQVEGTFGDIKVVRSKSDHSKKIDICIATLIGLSQTILQENKYSVYETQDFRFI